jgi:hypothetical protein
MPPASCSSAPHSTAAPLNVRVPRSLPGAPEHGHAPVACNAGRDQHGTGSWQSPLPPLSPRGNGRAPPVLRVIAADASLAGAASSPMWLPLRQPSGAFAGIRGGLVEDDEGAAPEAPGTGSRARHRRPQVPAGRRPRSSGSVRSAGARAGPRLRDLDHDEAMAGAVRQELARRSYGLTEVRIPGLLILSVTAAARPAGTRPGSSPHRREAILVRLGTGA